MQRIVAAAADAEIGQKGRDDVLRGTRAEIP